MDISASDFVTVGTLIVIEGLLSADNALVLAVLVKHLPEAQRKQALRYGIIGAFVFRFISVLLASFLIHAWYFKAAGSLYLLYISFSHLLTKSDTQEIAQKAKKMGFWQTVVFVELTDIVFSIDSILAAVALSNKIWVIYLGGILGIIAMRFVAGGFLKMLDHFPGLEKGAYVLVGWIGLKLGLHTAQDEIPGFPHLMPEWFFWIMMAVIFFGSLLWRPKSHTNHKLPKELE